MIFAFIIYNSALSQEYTNYFNPSNQKAIMVDYSGSYYGAFINFAFSEISTNRLDPVTTLHFKLEVNTEYYKEHYSWNQNNGNGNFGSTNTFYETVAPVLYEGQKTFGPIFMKLNDNSNYKDLVIVRADGLHIYQNNGSFSNFHVTYNSSTTNFGNSFDAGCFYNDDTREHLIVTDGNSVKVYRNMGDGSLNFTPYNYDISHLSKIKLKQMTDKNVRIAQDNTSDMDDLIGYFSYLTTNSIFAVKNNNNNEFEGQAYFGNSVTYTISDIEVADVNNDGYNDIIVCGTLGSSTGIAQIFLNNAGISINYNPYWSVTGNSFIGPSSKIAIADVDKDGINDIIFMSSLDGYTTLFLGKDLPYSSNPPTQTFYAAPTNNIGFIKAVDLYNTGANSLVYTKYYSPVNPPTVDYSIGIIPPLVYDPPPSPPFIFKKFVQVGNFWHPKLIISDKSDRDIIQYQIWKRGKDALDYILFATINSTQKEWIDMSEIIIWGEEEDPSFFNCFYFVKCIDASQLSSLYSNEVGYTVQVPIPIPPGIDNAKYNSNVNYLPNDYFLSNFPNPFNPSTKIYFTIPKEGNVKISIYDALGRKIKEFINEYKHKGAYIKEFIASGLSSGIYFYILESNGTKITKSMLLIK